MQQLRGDKLAMKAALDLILWCAYGNKSRAFPGGPQAALFAWFADLLLATSWLLGLR